MVALYNCRLTLAAFDYIGINRALNKVINLAYLLGYLFERTDELLAYYLALCFGVGNALEFFKEYRTVVHLNQVHAEAFLEHLHNLVCLILSEQAVVHKHAGELVAYRPVNERCRNGRVYAARHCTKHFFIADFRLEFIDFFRDETRHRPVAVRAAHIVQKVAEHKRAVLGMLHFRVELNAVNSALFAAECGIRAVIGMGNHFKTFGKAGYSVGMAHPAYGVFGHVLGKGTALAVYFRLAVFRRRGALNHAAEKICRELATVAYAENGYAERENFGADLGAALIVYAVGSARKNYAYGGVLLYFFDSHVARYEVAVYVLLAHAPCNKLIVLTAEVKYQNSFALHM